MTAEELVNAFYYPGDKEKVLSLLPVVCDPAGIRGSTTNSTNATLLHYAVRRGWTDVCRLLVEQYQVDPHCKTNAGETALHYAAQSGFTDVCRLLVEQYQVDPHCRNRNGYTALHRANFYNKLDVVVCVTDSTKTEVLHKSLKVRETIINTTAH